MSEEAQPVDAVEPGQGSEESPDALYADYLGDIPSEFHDKVIDGFKAKDADFTRRFTAVSDKWKPFEDHYENLPQWVELNETITAAQQGDQQANEAVQQWWEGMGEALGFYGENQQASEEDSGDDDFDILDLDKNTLRQMMEEVVDGKVSPIAETIQSQQEQQLEQQAEQVISERLEALKSENPDLTDEDIDVICELGAPFAENSDDPIQQGFERFQQIVSRGESQLFSKKAGQPRAAEGPGAANTAPQDVTLDNVRALAMEKAKAMASNA